MDIATKDTTTMALNESVYTNKFDSALYSHYIFQVQTV